MQPPAVTNVPANPSGETHFPRVGGTGLTVTPKLGRAILWPSVLDSKVRRGRTDHEAMPA